MATTPNYSFSVYSRTDTDVRFLDFRVATAGSQSTSNFYVIDTVLKQHSDAIDSINATPSAFVVKGTYSSGSLYTASVANYPGYKNEQLIVLSLNQKNTGAVQININGTTNKDVMKYGSDGVLKAVDAGDFVANSPVLCLYDGTRFVVIGITSASSITVTGEAGDILQIADDGTIESSGKKAAQPNGIATLDENGNVVQVANMANSAAAVYDGEPVSVEYVGQNRIASITAYGENAQGGTTEAPVALTGISSVTVNEDVTELPIPRPLRKVGDVRDVCRTRVKSVYDKRIVLDGTENWNISSSRPNSFLTPVSERIVNGLSDSYPTLKSPEIGTKNGIYLNYTADIIVTDLACSTVEEFKAHLSAHPLTVYYRSTAYDGTNGLDVCLTEYQTGYIESYADESITTAWISSTGELSTGAEVAYVLSSPETYATEPLDFDNAAGPLTVMTGGEVEVRMTELIGSRSPELTGKMDKATYDADGDGVVDKAAAVPWDGVTGKPGTFAPSAHTHDDRYYTETEMNTKLNGKADSGHTHTSIRIYNSDWSGTDGSIMPIYANANKDYVNLAAGNDADNKWPHISCQRINGHALNMSLSGTTLSITW